MSVLVFVLRDSFSFVRKSSVFREIYLEILEILEKSFLFQGAKILQASHFDYEYVLGHKIAFLCVAKGNPRPQITWLKDGSEIFQHMYMHVSYLQIPHSHNPTQSTFDIF